MWGWTGLTCRSFGGGVEWSISPLLYGVFILSTTEGFGVAGGLACKSSSALRFRGVDGAGLDDALDRERDCLCAVAAVFVLLVSAASSSIELFAVFREDRLKDIINWSPVWERRLRVASMQSG